MDLPELSPSAAPEFADADGARMWLEHVPLANVAAAQRQLLVQIEAFNRFQTSAAHRLTTMEALREAVNFVQIEQAKRFSNRALPMAEGEIEIFEDTDDLWDDMRIGYARCVQAGVDGETGMKAQLGLACQRALYYSGMKMFHHYRAYREVPASDWRNLNEVYRIAEDLDVVDTPVKDFLNRDVQDTSPRIAYARAVLMALSNPNELSQRQLTFVAYLLERWGNKLEITAKPVDEDLGVPPLVADLEGGRSPERLEPGSATKIEVARYLDTSKLAKSLRNRVGLLRKGESPAKLALGEDCVQPSCEQLLVFLYRQWCQPKSARASEGRRSSSAAEAVVPADAGAARHLRFLFPRTSDESNGDADMIVVMRTGVEWSAVEEVKKALESNDADQIKRALDSLTAAQSKAAESLYKNAQAGQQAAPGANAGAGAGEPSAAADGDVIDAEVVEEPKN